MSKRQNGTFAFFNHTWQKLIRLSLNQKYFPWPGAFFRHHVGWAEVAQIASWEAKEGLTHHAAWPSLAPQRSLVLPTALRSGISLLLQQRWLSALVWTHQPLLTHYHPVAFSRPPACRHHRVSKQRLCFSVSRARLPVNWMGQQHTPASKLASYESTKRANDS